VVEKKRGQGGDGEVGKMGNAFSGCKSIGASELGEGLEAVRWGRLNEKEEAKIGGG
jgi:hypothetical protein